MAKENQPPQLNWVPQVMTPGDAQSLKWLGRGNNMELLREWLTFYDLDIKEVAKLEFHRTHFIAGVLEMEEGNPVTQHVVNDDGTTSSFIKTQIHQFDYLDPKPLIG